MKEISLPWRDRAVILVQFEEHEAVDALLSGEEIAESESFRLEKRRREWRLARAAVKRLALRVGVADDARRVTITRPRLLVDGERTGWFVSLSHSGNYAGAICGDAPVGIDVQAVRAIAESAAHLFLSTEEETVMRTCVLPDRLLHFWCAKEAAWKQRSSEFTTMKQLPLAFEHASERGLRFDTVETVRIADVIVAITRQASPG